MPLTDTDINPGQHNNASYSSVHEVFYSCEIVNNCDLWKNGFPNTAISDR